MQQINFTTTVSIPQTSQLKFKISCWHSNFHRNNFIQASLYSSGVYEPPIITKRLIKILSCPYGSSFIKPLSSSCNFNVKKEEIQWNVTPDCLSEWRDVSNEDDYLQL